MIEIHSCRITYVFLKKLFVACFFGMSFSIPVFAEDYGMHNYESSQQKQAQTKKSIMVKGKVLLPLMMEPVIWRQNMNPAETRIRLVVMAEMHVVNFSSTIVMSLGRLFGGAMKKIQLHMVRLNHILA